MATALAAGVFAGMLLWEQGIIPCSVPWIGTLQASPLWRAGVGLLAIVLMPLVTPSSVTPLPLRRGQQSPRVPSRLALGIGLYTFLGVLIAWSRPVYPCLPPHHIATIVDSWGDEGRYVTLTGTVTGWPEPHGNHNRYQVAVSELFLGGERYPAQGIVLVRAPAYPLLEYGTLVRVRGYLYSPPVYEDFDYRGYLARRGIYAVMRAYEVVPLAEGHGAAWRRLLYAVRSQGHARINQLFLQPHAGLVNGIFLGIESNIPPSLMDAFNATGTSHILVISGFNISILAGLVISLLGPWLGRRRAALVAVAAIAVYVPLVGGEAAVVRAGIMGTLYALAMVLGRQTFGLASLFWAALIMIAFNPHTLWDVGFQLSFLATLGLLVLHPPLANRSKPLLAFLPTSWRSRVYAAVNEAVLITIAAHLATAPLIAAVFGRTSFIAPLANALVLPVQPPLMATAALSLLAGLVWPPLGQGFAMIPQALLAWTLFVVERMATWPGAGWPVPKGMRHLAILCYVLFGVYVAWVWYRTFFPGDPALPLSRWTTGMRKAALRRPLGWAAVVIPIVGLFLGTRAVATSATQWQVTRFPSGQVVLRRWDLQLAFVARGPRTQLEPEAFQGLPGGKRAVWVITHGEEEVLASLRVALEEHPPAAVVYPAFCAPEWPCPPAWHAFIQALAAYRVAALPLAPGMMWHVTRGLSLQYALVSADWPVYPIWARSQGWALLLPEDIPVPMQEKLPVPEGPAVWVLPGVASGTWPSPSWVQRLHLALLWRPDDVRYPPSAEEGIHEKAVQRFNTSIPLTFSFPPEDGERSPDR